MPGRRDEETAVLERIADAAWPAPVHERLGEWYLRAAGGWTSRGNSALPVGNPGRPLAEAVRACQQWYAERGLTPRITVPLPLARPVAEHLAARSWRAQPPVLVQTARIDRTVSRPETAAPVAKVELKAEPSPQFLALMKSWKSSALGNPGDPAAATLPPAALHLLTAVPLVRFAEVWLDGQLAAQGRGAVVDRTMHLGLVGVAPAARRRGLGALVTRALAAWAAETGANRALLQVEQQNTAAIRLYASLGFATHHTYVTYANEI